MCEALGIEEKVKEEKKPEHVQNTAVLHHLLLVLTTTISFRLHSGCLHRTCLACTCCSTR